MRGRRLGVGLVLLLALSAGSHEAEAKKKKKLKKPKKSLSLGKVAQKQKSADQERLDAALRHFKEEKYDLAAVSLYDVATADDVAADITEAAQYNLAKALYRMELHHASLGYFNSILKKGPSTKYYRSALEWSLFVARKTVADDRVLEAVAKYSDGKFPADYKDEFKYLLARHHYLRGLAIETGTEIGKLGETKVKETVSGGKSIKGDVFDDMDGGEEEVEEEEDEDISFKRGGKGGFSVSEDIFGDEEEEKEPEPEIAPALPPAAGADGELTAKEHFEAARRYVLQVDSNSPFAARAKFLEGVLLFRNKAENDSLNAFKAVVRMTKEGSPQEDPALRQLAFFQLARTHFGAKQPSFSIFYYAKMERFTYDWLEALYEASWAEFRLGNYEKALGNLLTLHSPFFVDEYFPESHILKAVVYYENCRYPEASEILKKFKDRYELVLKELDELTKGAGSTSAYYETLNNLRSEDIAKEGGAEKAKLLSQILSIALSDKELKRLDRSYKEVNRELKAINEQGAVFTGSPLKGEVETDVALVLKEYERAAGKAVKRKLERERKLIKSLLTQAIRIEIETARGEQERIESKLRGVQSGPVRRRGEFVEWADDEKLVWPFEEEYWRDELGTYELTLAHTCRR